MWYGIFVLSNHMEICHICLNIFFSDLQDGILNFKFEFFFFSLQMISLLLFYKKMVLMVNRFDGKKFLERSIGKKIMFVGDSISNNMWQSLTCLLHIAVPNSNYTLTSQTQELLVFSVPVVILFSFTFSFLESIELL